MKRKRVDQIGVERTGHPSCVHIGLDWTGMERIGSEGKEPAIFHASTKEWRAGEGIGAERRG